MFPNNRLLMFDEILLIIQHVPCDVELSHLGYIFFNLYPIYGEQHCSVEGKVLRTKFDFELVFKTLLP